MKRIVFLFSFLSIQLTAFSQLGVGTNSPDASAQLDVTSSDKGFLAPRIALTSATDVTTIATPATGLMVYNTATAGTTPNNVIPGYYYYDGTKWVRFINAQPSATISFSTADPNSGSPTFTPNTPQNTGYIYVSAVNSSLWVWNGSAYVSYTAPSTTPFYLTGSTTDAGGNKTANIYRTGSMGVGLPANVATTTAATLDVNGTGLYRSGNNSNLNATNQIMFSHNGTTNYKHAIKSRHNSLAPAGNAIDFYLWDQTIDAIGNVGNKHVMTLDGNGYVGIGTTVPLTTLHVVNPLLATNSVNVNAQVLRLARPTTNSVKWDNIAQFNLGSYSASTVYATTRLDLALTNGGDNTTLSNIMTWQANGNVGIGTTAPTTNLDVVGGISVRNVVGSAGSNYGIEFNSNASSPRIDWVYNGGYIGQFTSDANDFLIRNSKQTTGGFRFYTNPSGSQVERLTILNNGNVGIGNNSPSVPLVVQGVVGNGVLKLIAPSVSAGDNWWMGFGHGTNSTDANDRVRIGVDIVSGGAGRLFLTTGAPNNQIRAVFIDENQKVGIGTSSPVTPLHIVGAFTEDITSQDNFSNGINIRKRGNSSASTGAVASGAEIGYHSFSGWNGTGYVRGAYAFASAAENFTATANGTNYAIFTTANGTTANVERFKIMHNGNVGIGTSNPNGGLTLYGPASLALPVNIQGSGGPTKELVFGRGGLTTGFAAITGVDNGQYGGGLSFIVKPSGSDNFPTNAIQAMVLDWNGNMGLGTGSPTQRLDVNGRVRIRTIDTGVATDSVLVVNGGVVKRVSKGASVNIQTADYTLTASDNGNIVIMNSATAVTITVPATLPAGFVVQIIQKGAGQVTVSGSGSTINSANGFKTRVTNSAIGVVMESSTVGYVTGDSNF